jgi:hypothetical protein
MNKMKKSLSSLPHGILWKHMENYKMDSNSCANVLRKRRKHITQTQLCTFTAS